jgi:hypothetical protein
MAPLILNLDYSSGQLYAPVAPRIHGIGSCFGVKVGLCASGKTEILSPVGNQTTAGDYRVRCLGSSTFFGVNFIDSFGEILFFWRRTY